ncbi:hypothetical protein [Burkholderia ubonensis]|uniref:hypothetical protein n=1 Tax=Burkholderia ubonensis TaxID=101571 RepID=UPI0009B2ECEC|nr:hypothetical protein [Burkholderia ubonensis]
MEPIAAVTAPIETGARYAGMMRPFPVDPPANLAKAVDPARKIDLVDVVRQAEATLARDDVLLMKGVTNLAAGSLSIASLHQLQVRTILFKVKHEATTGIVTNLNQSIRTVLNAA